MNSPHFVLYRHAGYYHISWWALLMVISLSFRQSHGMLYQEELNIQDLGILFGEEECIEGTLSVSDIGSVDIQPLVFTETTVELNEVEEKSSMSMLNELAYLNQIEYHYTLIGEEGPDHHKQFNVSLRLGEETYFAEGSSIKKAQHSAAKNALESTIYNHPPKKEFTKKSNQKYKGHQNSIQKLEGLVSKHWNEPLIYSYQGQSSLSHDKFYHNDMYSTPSLHKVTVRVGKHEYSGEGLTLDIAKEKAAKSALQELNDVSGFCLLEDKNKNLLDLFYNSDNNNHSPTSIVHEFASRSQNEISFEIISEEGPPHLKVFTFKCRIGDKFVSYGKGEKKKTAKNEAALNMIEQLKSHAYDNNINCGGLITKNKKKKKQKSKKLTKSVTKQAKPEMKLQYSFPDDINPISKLIQIQQVNNDFLPVFTLLDQEESSNGFSIQVKVGDLVSVGIGPNKKTAKRKAAEQMLETLGYSRGSGEIRASLSEQKKKGFLNQNVDSSKTPLTPGLQLNLEAMSTMNHGKEPSHVSSQDKMKPGKKVEAKFPVNDNLKETKNKKTPIETKSKKTPIESNLKTPIAQLDVISQDLRFRFQFSDFPKSNNSGFVSLLSLTTDPPKVCVGSGFTTDASQNNAAAAALRVLYKTHVFSISKLLQEPSKDTVSKESFKFVREVVVNEDIITEL